MYVVVCLYVYIPLSPMQKFHGNVQSACMKVHETNVLHQFRMSAVAFVDGLEVEGELSEVTPQCIVLIPKAGSYMHTHTLNSTNISVYVSKKVAT